MKNIPVRSINRTANEPGISESFTIREVGALLGGKDMVQELHRHDFFFILALEKGAGEHEIDFIPHHITNHAVFIMHPGQVHQLLLKSGSTGYLIQFKGDFNYSHNDASRQMLRKGSSESFCQLNANRNKKIRSILANIFQEYNDKKEGYQDAIKANLSIFLIELARHRHPRKGAPNETRLYEQERLEEFLELLEGDLANHKQSSHYANLLNLSLYQLNAITKRGLGKTSSALIDERIILESKRHLLATSNQISQIASNLGFEDVSYFIRFFRQHTGYSPEVFRKNFR